MVLVSESKLLAYCGQEPTKPPSPVLAKQMLAFVYLKAAGNEFSPPFVLGLMTRPPSNFSS